MKSPLDLAALVRRGEDQYFECKSLFEGPPGAKRSRDRRIVRDEIAEHVAAFANADGGVLVMGIEDNGAVTGHAYPDEAIEGFLDAPAGRLRPAQRRGEVVAFQDQQVLVFDVDAAPSPVMVTGAGFPYRSKDAVIAMRESDLDAIKRRGIVEGVETQLVRDRGLVDLDEALIARAKDGAGLSSLSSADYLARRGLAAWRGDTLVLRQAALFVFARAPEFVEHPNAGIRIFRVRGRERLTGKDYNVQELPLCDGALPAAFEQAQRVLDTLIHKPSKLQDDGVFRETPEYPTVAWQEALVNALAHRDYGIRGACVGVWLYEDRMEVVSPGRLVPEVKLEELRVRRRLHLTRNPLVTRALADLGVVRLQGEGIPRMFQEMERAWLSVPELLEEDAFFRVVLRNEPIVAGVDRAWVELVQRLDLAAGQRRALIRFATTETGFASGDYQELNGVDRDQAYRELQQLVDASLLTAAGQTSGMRYRVVQAGAEPRLAATPAQRLGVRMDEAGFITNADYREAFGVDREEAKRALADLVSKEVLVGTGEKRGARYHRGPRWPGGLFL